MDKFIEDFAQRPLRQQILITIGVCLFLIGLIGASYFLTSTAPRNKASSTVPNNSNSSVPTSETTSSQPNTAWQIYTTDIYQLSYPQDLTGTPGVISGGGGTAFVLDGKEGSTDYNIEIQITDSSQTPVGNIYGVFRGFGYKEEETTLKSVIAKKFSGNVASITETAVVFENRGKVYKIQLSYQSSGRNPQIDQVFDSILATFTFI